MVYLEFYNNFDNDFKGFVFVELMYSGYTKGFEAYLGGFKYKRFVRICVLNFGLEIHFSKTDYTEKD